MEKIIDDNKIVELVNISFAGSVATAELLNHFKTVAENSGLDSPQEAFKAWAFARNEWPTKTKKDGTVVPSGWQAGQKLAREILNERPEDKKAIVWLKHTTVFNNLASMASLLKKQAKKQEPAEPAEPAEQLIPEFVVDKISEIREILYTAIKNGSKLKKQDLLELIEYTAEYLGSI